MPNSTSPKKYSLVTDPVAGTTGTGLDQFVGYIYADPGLAGSNDRTEIAGGASAADQLNHLILRAAGATGAAADGVFTTEEVVAMNAYIRANFLPQWTALHGDDEDGYETGYHLVQNDGANLRYRGDNLLDTVADGVYHMGFEICDGRFLNEDGDPNACVDQVADWLTQFYTDHSTTGTRLDRLTDMVMADAGLDGRIGDAEIAAGADAANGLNRMLLEALKATGVANDNWISAEDVVTLSNYLRADPVRAAQWAQLHGDDAPRLETGFHRVQGDGGNGKMFGEKFVNTVAEGIYDLGFAIRDGRLTNEDGAAGVTTAQVADWLNYLVTDQSTTGTGLDRIVDFLAVDPGLSRYTSAADIVGGLQAADGMNHIVASLINRTAANADKWITVDEVMAMNGLIRGDAALLQQWTTLHGDDEDSGETGYHRVQNDGANSNFLGRNLADTVADGIYHLGFEVCDGRFLNEDGDANASVADVATWLNYFYNGATIVMGDGCGNQLAGDGRDEQINAGGGDDQVLAGAGDDLVYGSWGNDSLAGEDGNDLIYGGSGNDSVAGGNGNDVFRVTGTKGSGFEGFDQYDGGAGTDRIVAYGAAVDIGVTAFGPSSGVEVIDATAVTGPVRILGDWNVNTLDFSGVSILGNVTIDGGGGDDTIVGSAGNDVIEGGSWGNQNISGGVGDDQIHAGGGNDVLSGGDGNDVFRVTGAKGKEFEGYDSYQGGAGQDSIVGYGATVDIGMTAFGPSNGLDVIDLSAVTGNARILGDWNANLLDFSGITILGKATIDGGGGDDTIVGSAGNDIIEGGAWGNQNLSGGGGDDVLHGGSGNDVLSGGDGNDIFRVTGNKSAGFEGYDSYQGGAGNDSIVATGSSVDIGMTAFGPANGMDVVDLSAVTGPSRLLGDWNDNVLDFSGVALLGNVSIEGGGGNDMLIGSAGGNVIRGDSGDDLISGLAGNDLLTGGSGKDVFIFGGGWGHDTVTDYRDGSDKLDFRGSGAKGMGDLSITQVGADTLISFGGNEVLLSGVQTTKLDSSDFVF
jgi:Ca2+-binding RTX toxin-like protein